LAWGLIGCGFGALAVAAATRRSPRFDQVTSISAKIGLAISPGIFAAALKSEHTMSGANRDPAAYGIFEPGTSATQSSNEKITQLPHGQTLMKPWHHAMNFFYQKPFQVIAGVGGPLVGYIFYTQRSGQAMKMSQKIMATRLYGQTAVLGILLGSMALHDYIRHNGGIYTEERLAREYAAKK
jgi:hypothetical protein